MKYNLSLLFLFLWTHCMQAPPEYAGYAEGFESKIVTNQAQQPNIAVLSQEALAQHNKQTNVGSKTTISQQNAPSTSSQSTKGWFTLPNFFGTKKANSVTSDSNINSISDATTQPDGTASNRQSFSSWATQSLWGSKKSTNSTDVSSDTQSISDVASDVDAIDLAKNQIFPILSPTESIQKILPGSPEYTAMMFGAKTAPVSKGVQDLIAQLTDNQSPDMQAPVNIHAIDYDPNIIKTTFNGGFDSKNNQGITVRVDLKKSENGNQNSVSRVQVVSSDFSVQVIDINADGSYAVKTLNKSGVDPNKVTQFNADGTEKQAQPVISSATTSSQISKPSDPALVSKSVQMINMPNGTKEQVTTIKDSDKGIYTQMYVPVGQTIPTSEMITRLPNAQGVMKKQGTFIVTKPQQGSGLIVEYKDPNSQHPSITYALTADLLKGIRPDAIDATVLNELAKQAQEKGNDFPKYKKSQLTTAFLQSQSYLAFKQSLL